MALSYDFSAKLIHITSPQTAVLCQDLINDIRTAEADWIGITHDKIAIASGKDTLASGVTTAITINLQSTWQLDFYAGNYTATIGGGNLVNALGDVVAYVVGGPQVELTLSAAATIVNTGGTSPTANQIADAVWAHSSGLSVTTKLTLIEKILRNKTVTDPATGIMYIYDNDNTTVLIQANIYENTSGAQAYRGQGAERRDRLQ